MHLWWDVEAFDDCQRAKPGPQIDIVIAHPDALRARFGTVNHTVELKLYSKKMNGHTMSMISGFSMGKVERRYKLARNAAFEAGAHKLLVQLGDQLSTLRECLFILLIPAGVRHWAHKPPKDAEHSVLAQAQIACTQSST